MTTGFLRHNRFPARIYMGETGNFSVGFILSVLAWRMRSYESHRRSFLVPTVVLAVPIFNIMLVVVARCPHRRNSGRLAVIMSRVALGTSLPASTLHAPGGEDRRAPSRCPMPNRVPDSRVEQREPEGGA